MKSVPTGFYAILDTGYVTASNWLIKARALLDGGAVLLQVRAKGLAAGEVLQLARQVEPLCAAAGVPLIINDHLEVAMAIAGAGLHLGQDDMDVNAARHLLGPDRLLGKSTHSLQQAQQAIAQVDILDYFAVGPVFATGTKPTYVPVGLELVRAVAALRPPLPFFAIGGIHRGNARAVLEAGASGLVAVSDPLLAEDTSARVRQFAAWINGRSGT